MSVSHPKIVATGPIDSVAIDILRPFGKVLIAPNPREETILSLLHGTIGLIVRGEGRATAELIEKATDLKVIGRPGVGYDSVDIGAATRRKIPVVYTPGAGARAVAEASVTLMLALAKGIPYWDHQFKQGNWQSRYGRKPGDLDGATLGIIGFGRIGQTLAELARPFNMEILAHDPYQSPERFQQLGVDPVELNDLLSRSDFICLHALLTDQTRGIMNRERLNRVKPGAYLINLARGGLIESLDILYDALKEGTLAGVGLDVFEPEPPDFGHPLFKLPNCLTSPHSLGMSHRAMTRIFQSMAKDMAAVITGSRPRFLVNPEIYA